MERYGWIANVEMPDMEVSVRRLVWSAEGGITKHYNASVQVFNIDVESTRIVWIADFFPDAGVMDMTWITVAFFIWGAVSAIAFFWSLGYHAWLELSVS